MYRKQRKKYVYYWTFIISAKIAVIELYIPKVTESQNSSSSWVGHLNRSLVARLSLSLEAFHGSLHQPLSHKAAVGLHVPSRVPEASESTYRTHSWFYLYQWVSRGSQFRAGHTTGIKIQGIGHTMAQTAFLALLSVCHLTQARVFNLSEPQPSGNPMARGQISLTGSDLHLLC